MAAEPRLEVGYAELSVHGQDRGLVRPEQRLFGVFDGLGSFVDSGRAAQLAADTVAARWAPDSRLDARDRLAGALRAADRAVSQQTDSATTAAVAAVVGAELHFVSVGDSRIYHGGAFGLRQLTQDEGKGHILDNWLGAVPVGMTKRGVVQAGSAGMTSGDYILLVSDGVTGDYGEELLGTRELAGAVGSLPAQAAAERLIQVARKWDDRTAIVVRLLAWR